MDKAVFQTNFNSLMHAALDGNIAFVRAHNKLTNREVYLLCFVNREVRPPLVIGGEARIVERTVPVCEFVLDDAMSVYTALPDGEPKPDPDPRPSNIVQLRPPGLIVNTPPAGNDGNVSEVPNGPESA